MAKSTRPVGLPDSLCTNGNSQFISEAELRPCAEAEWSVGCRPRTASSLTGFLSVEETISHLCSIGLTQDGIDYVIQALHSRPSRKVGGAHQRSRIGEILSYVQGGFREVPTAATIQFESSSEHNFAICISANPSTLFLIDQPTTISVPWTSDAGRVQDCLHTPDYLVIYRDKVVVYEIKPLEVLTSLIKDRPHHWAYENGLFTYLPPHKHFEEMGITHQVVPSETISWIYSENLRIVSSPAIVDSECDEHTLSRIRRFVARNQPTCLATVLERLRLPNGMDILRAISDGQVFVDLERCSLWDPENLSICSTPANARLVGTAVHELAAEARRGEDMAWVTCNPKHLLLVGLRFALVIGADTSEFGSINTYGERTHQRLRKAYKDQGLQGLFPKWDKCGRKRKYSAEDIDFAIARIRIDRGSTNHDSVQQSFARYRLDISEAAKQGKVIGSVGISLYYGLWKRRRHNLKDAHGVGGKRKANSDSPYGDPAVQKPLCTLPFQVAHSDHCSLPVLCRESERFPQLSSLVCHKHQEILAAVVRFEPPSTATLGLLMRQCVRKHGYLPRYIYTDCGSDYRSKQFIIAMAELGVCIMHRPPAKAKAGSEIERYHWTLQETAIKGGTGYVPPVKTTRGVSSSHQPKNLELRRHRDLLVDINIAIDMINDGSAYEEDGQDLIRLRKQSEDLFGPQGVPHEMDFRFHVCTSPFIKDAHSVTEARGAIRWNDRRYLSPVLVGQSIKVTALHPRLDPESGGSVMYFFLNGRWHTAICRERLASAGRSIESILKEAAHDYEARGATASLLPLHEAIEVSRRTRRGDNRLTSYSGPDLSRNLRVAASDYQSPESYVTSGSSNDEDFLVAPTPCRQSLDSALPDSDDIDEWDDLGEIEIHDGDAP